MNFDIHIRCYCATDEELIADVKRVAQELNKTYITTHEYTERGIVTARTVYERLGPWYHVMKLAGLQTPRGYYKIPDEELFRNIEQVWRTLGRQPIYLEIRKPLSMCNGSVYEKRFGTWRKALEAFVAYINSGAKSPENPDAENIVTKRARIRKPNRNINWRMRHLVMRQDNFKCRLCGKSPAKDPEIELEVDHIVPVSRGGETVMENLQTLCTYCNIGKSNI
jgi:hypothetical protein